MEGLGGRQESCRRLEHDQPCSQNRHYLQYALSVHVLTPEDQVPVSASSLATFVMPTARQFAGSQTFISTSIRAAHQVTLCSILVSLQPRTPADTIDHASAEVCRELRQSP